MSEIMASDGIACSLKVVCSEELELQKQQNTVMENVKAINECPILQEESTPRRLYLALLKNESVLRALQFIISATSQIFGEV